MRKRMVRLMASAMLVLPAGGCLVQALLNPEIAQPRIQSYVDQHPDLASNWMHWYVDLRDDLTAE